MKKILTWVMFFVFSASIANAFLYQVPILTKEEIKKVSDQQLMDSYIEAVIERSASETFHGKAGFTPKEYNNFKDLLGFIVRLRQEMLKREMETPPVDEWLRH